MYSEMYDISLIINNIMVVRLWNQPVCSRGNRIGQYTWLSLIDNPDRAMINSNWLRCSKGSLTVSVMSVGCFGVFFFLHFCLACGSSGCTRTLKTQPISAPYGQGHSIWSVWHIHEQSTGICILSWVIAPYFGKPQLYIHVVANMSWTSHIGLQVLFFW